MPRTKDSSALLRMACFPAIASGRTQASMVSVAPTGGPPPATATVPAPARLREKADVEYRAAISASERARVYTHMSSMAPSPLISPVERKALMPAVQKAASVPVALAVFT